jgi:hypothetical protein
LIIFFARELSLEGAPRLRLSPPRMEAWIVIGLLVVAVVGTVLLSRRRTAVKP